MERSPSSSVSSADAIYMQYICELCGIRVSQLWLVNLIERKATIIPSNLEI